MKMTIVLYLLNIFIFVFGTSQLVLKIKSNYTRITLVLLVVAIVPLEGDEPDGGDPLALSHAWLSLELFFNVIVLASTLFAPSLAFSPFHYFQVHRKCVILKGKKKKLSFSTSIIEN